MSAKRYLLIAAALWAVALSAQVTNWIYTSAYHYRTLSKTHLTGLDFNSITDVTLGKYHLELDNRFTHLDRENLKERHDRQTLKPQLTLSRKWQTGYGKVYYRGEYYNLSPDRYLYDVADFPALKRTYDQHIGIAGSFQARNLDIDWSTRHRTFFYNPSFDAENKIVQTNNLTSSAEIGYKVVKPIKVFVAAYDKSALDDKTDIYDCRSAGAGIALDLQPFSPAHNLQARAQIDWIKSDILSTESYINPDTFMPETRKVYDRLIPVTGSLRYSYMLNPQLMGYTSFENRLFYDTDQQEMLFNNMFVRTSGKYTFAYDPAHASFMELGAKYSPRMGMKHRSSALYTQTEMKAVNRFYMGGGVNHMIKRLTRYNGVIRYFITPWNEVFVDYTYTDDIEFKEFTTYTSAGVRVQF